MNGPIRLLIAEESRYQHCQVMSAIRHARDIEMIGNTSSAKETERLCLEKIPDVLLAISDMLSDHHIESLSKISRSCPEIKIIVMTSATPDLLAMLFQNGICGYLEPNMKRHEIPEAIRTVVRGGAVLSPQLAARILDEVSGKYRLGRF